MSDFKSNKSLVLVVGAGASKEALLPTGDELRQKIAAALDIRIAGFGDKKVSGDDLIAQALNILTKSQGRPQDIGDYFKTARRISGAMPQAQSIDNFIDSHKKNIHITQCGKLAIARCILDAEASSLMKVGLSNNKIDFSSLEETWFNAFFQLVVENCGHEDLPERLAKLAIISFNYDRCIEHFLHSSFQNYYGVSPEQASELMSNLDIYHPYGIVGPLPWMDRTSNIEFGQTPDPQQLLELSRSLRTFTEGTDEKSSDIIAIRSVLQTAKRVAFLGFAFHQLNLELLYGSPTTPVTVRDCPVYATAYGLSLSDLKIIGDDLSKIGGHDHRRIFLRFDRKAGELFREYWRSLSLS